MINKIGVYHTRKQHRYLGKVKEMHDKGYTVPEIAKRIEMSENTVYGWLKAIEADSCGEVKVPAKPKDEPAAPKPEPISKTATGIDSVVEDILSKLDEEAATKSFFESASPEKQAAAYKSVVEENRRLRKALIEEAINSASLASALKEEREQKDEDAGKSPQELKQINKQLRKQLKREHMRAEVYDTMIDIAEGELGVNIRKKPGAKQ